jgi:hypothetical protein
MSRRPTFPILLAALLGLTAAAPAFGAEDDRARQLVQSTIQEFGGSAFLDWKDMYGEGRIFMLKEGRQSWTKFWDFYRWSGKSRTDFDKRAEGLSDIFNLDLGKGWTYEYGKVKPKTEDDMRRFRLAEKRNLANLFRERWKEPGMKVLYVGPNEIDTTQPMEALEFLDTENYSVTVYYEEGKALPVKLEYRDRNQDGIVLNKAEMYFRWFRFQGILTPLRVEMYTNGRQTGLVEYSLVQYNTGLSESLFTEPAPVVKKK